MSILSLNNRNEAMSLPGAPSFAPFAKRGKRESLYRDPGNKQLAAWLVTTSQFSELIQRR